MSKGASWVFSCCVVMCSKMAYVTIPLGFRCTKAVQLEGSTFVKINVSPRCTHQWIRSIAIYLMSVFFIVSQASAVVVLPEYHPGKNHSVQTGKVSVLINVPSRKLWLLDSVGRLLREYPVAAGRPQFPTPKGQFSIIRMVKNPGFENPYKAHGASRIAPGNNNPLGTRWMGFKANAQGEYGIHGTNRPQSVGQLSSHGCVRMYVRDAEDLFDRVTFGTPVVVSYDRTVVKTRGHHLILTFAPNSFGDAGAAGSDVTTAIRHYFPEAEIEGGLLNKAMETSSLQQRIIGTVPDPQAYDKKIETSVSGVIKRD